MDTPLSLQPFVVIPRLHCHFAPPSSPTQVCAGKAVWMAPGTTIGAGGYFCDQHRPIGAIAIADDAVFRRVKLTVQVILGGASWDKSIAQTEALRRLERAVHLLGGYLDVVSVTSEVGRGGPQACAPGAGLRELGG